MKELFPSDRPREKLVRHGVAARGGLHGLVRSTCDELADVAGIGPARSSQILAALELGRRTLAHAPSARLRIRSPRDAAAYLMPTYGSQVAEQFGVVLLDSKHRVIRTTVVALGTLNTTVVEPRDVFREAVAGRAAAIVVFHKRRATFLPEQCRPVHI